MVAAFFNKPKITQFLIDDGADLRIKNNEDKDCFQIADEKNHFETRLILAKQFEKMGIKRKPTKQRVAVKKTTSNEDIFSI